MEVTGPLSGVCSLLLPSGSQGSHLGNSPWWRAPLPAGPSPGPSLCCCCCSWFRLFFNDLTGMMVHIYNLIAQEVNKQNHDVTS